MQGRGNHEEIWDRAPWNEKKKKCMWMIRKNDACDQYVSNLMGEMQRMEAKMQIMKVFWNAVKMINRLKRLALTLNDAFSTNK